MRGHALTGAFFCYLIFFQASMLGLVLADNIITLFVFWELTTVTSYLLIGFDHQSEKARRNAWQALLVTGAGGLALLAGLILLAPGRRQHGAVGVDPGGRCVQQHPLYGAILVLVLLGAFTKSAQVPFHFWLPNAMAAPTPVSAYLHSATMVKAGIYLLARMHPALSGTPDWIWTLTIVGAITAVWASIVAMRQTDLKLALAYTTVMALGTLTMFLGSGGPYRHHRGDDLPDRPLPVQVRRCSWSSGLSTMKRAPARWTASAVWRRPCRSPRSRRRRRRSPWPGSRRSSGSSARSSNTRGRWRWRRNPCWWPARPSPPTP